jgi:hypothetical protein
MVYDSRRGKTVLFGGWISSPPNSFLNDTWEWNGSSWAQTNLWPGPARFDHAMVYDSQHWRTVLFGGNSSSTLDDTWTWSDGIFGTGCGNPALVLASIATARPILSMTAQASLANIPSSVAFVSLGWSRFAMGPVALPLTLAGIGMPGCDLLQSADAAALPVTSTGAGTATFNLPIPNWSVLVGLDVYLQGWAWAPGANSGNAIVSNGLEWRISY